MTLLVLAFSPVLFVAVALWAVFRMEAWIRDALAYPQEEEE